MKLKPTNKEKYKECSGCGQRTNTRTLNIRYQDFRKTYRSTNYNPNRDHFWIYNTKSYVLCKNCQVKFLKRLENI